MRVPVSVNADSFIRAKQYYSNGIVAILRGCVQAYNQLLSDGIVCNNNENQIRNVLVNNYLKKKAFKKKYQLDRFLFLSEAIEGDGRADIQVFPPQKNFLDDSQYYLIECKRLDNKGGDTISGLNAKYLANGVYRFVSEYYSCNLRCNGVFGFVVSDIDINANVKSINGLLGKNIKDDKGNVVSVPSIGKLCPCNKKLIPGFQYVYKSRHTTIKGKRITLYHLMFDFSRNVKP